MTTLLFLTVLMRSTLVYRWHVQYERVVVNFLCRLWRGARCRLLTDTHVGCPYHLAAQLLTVIV